MRFDTLDQWLDWQATLHPKEIELGLDRVIAVWQRLQPEGLQSKVVTVAGTNGKGSSVAMLEAIYNQAGFSVGTYTSPHLVRYNERIRLKGVAVSDQQLCHAFEAIDKARDQVSLTYFEFATLAALMIFAAEKPDLVILEVGLGGRLDAVNIIDTDVALITTIDLDHTDLLGDDLDSIGREKAGIIRPHRPVVLGDQGMPQSVSDQAAQLQAAVYWSGREFDFDMLSDGWQWSGPEGVKQRLPVPSLSGSKQLVNASAVVMVCQLLQDFFPLNWSVIAEGFQQVRLHGRLQWVPGKPTLLLDVAHNRQSLETLSEALDRLDWPGQIHALFGMLRDKDVHAVVDTLGSRMASWYLLDLPGERGRSAKQLSNTLRQFGVSKPIKCFHAFPQAYQACRDKVHSNDLVLVFGSFLVVGEAMGYLDLPT